MQIQLKSLKPGDLFRTDNRVCVLHSFSPFDFSGQNDPGVRAVVISGPERDRGPIEINPSTIVHRLDADFYLDDECVARTYANQEEISHEPLVAERPMSQVDIYRQAYAPIGSNPCGEVALPDERNVMNMCSCGKMKMIHRVFCTGCMIKV